MKYMQAVVQTLVLLIASLPLWLSVPAMAATLTCQSQNSDSDGDGFGWENGRSCRVVESRLCAQPGSDSDGDGFGWENGMSCKVSTTGPVARPVCSDAASDSDGDGFGWENGKSCTISKAAERPDCRSAVSDIDNDGYGWEHGRTCVVRTQTEERYRLTHPACSESRYDTDGDGYGWENSRTCSNRNFGDGGRSITDVVLVTGQSNALGAQTAILETPRFDDTIDSPVRRVYAYTNAGWSIAGLRQIWDRNWYPRGDIANLPANNFAFHFAKQLVLKDPNKVVGIILVTAPGQPIAHWDKNGEFFQQVGAKVESALNALPQKTAVDAVLWHQGESDYNNNDYYSNKLRQLIANFRGESWVENRALFICGETLSAPVNARLMALNQNTDSTTGCVRAADLDSLGDGIHFSAESLRTLGVRYATKYIEMSGRN